MNYRKQLWILVMMEAGIIAVVTVYMVYGRGQFRYFESIYNYSIANSYPNPSSVINVAKMEQSASFRNKNAQIMVHSTTDKMQAQHIKTKPPKALKTTPKITNVIGITASVSAATVTTTGSPKFSIHVAVVNNDFLVPLIVHYTWYSTRKVLFRFHHFISVLSAYKHIKPATIMFWYEMKPRGPWWDEINRRVPVIEMVFRKGPTEIYGNRIKIPEHQSDVVRLEAVLKYGGIYIDLDVVVVKSFDPLRNYITTMGYESSYGLCNGIIISAPAPDAPFLKIWLEAYKSFNGSKWAHHSVLLPATLAREHANLIHTENRTLHRPNWNEKGWLYDIGKIWDWSKNYTLFISGSVSIMWITLLRT